MCLLQELKMKKAGIAVLKALKARVVVIQGNIPTAYMYFNGLYARGAISRRAREPP